MATKTELDRVIADTEDDRYVTVARLAEANELIEVVTAAVAALAAIEGTLPGVAMNAR